MQELKKQQWEEYYAKLYSYFYKRISDRFMVEDLCIETLEVYYLSDQEIEKPYAFLYAIARNKILEYIRSKQKQSSVLEIEHLESQPSKAYLLKKERLIECAKSQLSGSDWDIVEMSVLSDFKAPRIAQEIGIKPDNVRKRLSRALAKLRVQCRKIWYEEYYH